METRVKNYTSINEVLSRVTRNPLLTGVTKESVVQYIIDFMSIVRVDLLYEIREDVVSIEDYRGVIPCNVIDIQFVKDERSDIALKGMTDEFLPKDKRESCCNHQGYMDNKSYRIQGNVIYVSFKKGSVRVKYTTVKTDDSGFPMLVDNPLFLKALEDYIKVQEFEILFEQGKMNQNVLNHAEQQSAWSTNQWIGYCKVPTVAEMESAKNMWCTLIQRSDDFVNSFETLGRKEKLRVH